MNIHGFWMYYEEHLLKIRAALTEGAKVVASGKLALPFRTTYKLSRFKEAIEHAQRGGKVLLDFTDPNQRVSQASARSSRNREAMRGGAVKLIFTRQDDRPTE